MRGESFYRFFALVIVAIFLTLKVFGQENDTLSSKQAEETFDFIILNSKVNDRFTFLGRDFGRRIPLANMDVMYYANTGWYLNASVFKFLEQTVPLQYGITAGYQTDLSSKTDMNLSYSQFFIFEDSDITGIQNMGLLQGTFGLDWNYLYSTLQAQALWNEKPDLFLVSKHSRYFEFDQKLFNALTVSFEPSISFTFGTSNFYYLGEFEEYQVPNPESPESFAFLGWDMEIPVNFEFKNWAVELQGRLVVPGNTPDFDASATRMVFGCQLFYFIPLKRRGI